MPTEKQPGKVVLNVFQDKAAYQQAVSDGALGEDDVNVLSPEAILAEDEEISSSMVRSVNGALPDENGEVHLGSLTLDADPTADMEAVTKQYADGKKSVWYGVCNTSSGTVNKVVTTTTGDFTLTEGNVLFVKISSGHTASSMTLNVDGTGSVQAQNEPVDPVTGYTQVGENMVSYDGVACFVYRDGIFCLYGEKRASSYRYGATILSSATNSSSTSAAATPSAVKKAYDLAAAALPASGGTLTGSLTLASDPTEDLQPATKQYVDNLIGNLLNGAS